MKKFLVLLLSFIMIFSTLCVSSAVEIDDDLLSGYVQGDIMLLDGLISPNPNSTIRVKLDDKYIDFTDANGNVVEPQIINDRTMVPFRKIFNELGVTDENITYTSSEEPIIASGDDAVIKLQIGSTSASKTVNGVTTNITLDSAPVIVDGRTLVPVRFIAESLEKKVGWDAYNRTVIIIDEEKLQSELETAAPKYFELLKLQTVKPNTYDVSMNLNGTLKYTDSSDKSNNTNITLDGKIDMVKAADAVSMDINAKLSGKGVMFDAVKSAGLQNIDLSIIITKDAMYLKSSLVEETNGKWVMEKDDSLNELFETLNQKNDAELLNIDEDSLTIYTYDSYKMVIDMFKELLGDDKLTITEGKTTKFEWNMNLDDLLAFMKKSDSSVDTTTVTDVIKAFDVSLDGTIKDGLNDEAKVGMNLKAEQDTESIELEIKVDAKYNSYNKTYTIKVPTGNDVMDVSTIY